MSRVVFFVVHFPSFSSFSCGRVMPARAMAPLWGGPSGPPEDRLGQLRGQWTVEAGAGAVPLASPVSPSLASLALGALLAALVVCGSVVVVGGQYERGPVQVSAYGARARVRRGPGPM